MKYNKRVMTHQVKIYKEKEAAFLRKLKHDYVEFLQEETNINDDIIKGMVAVDMREIKSTLEIIFEDI